MSHIFISYSREDVDFARYLRAQFETEGYRVWMDEQRLHPGSDWWDEIENNIITCSAFVVVMSPNSAQSKWVKREILCAEDNHRPIFPILLAGKVFGRLADLQAEDMIGGITAKLSARLLMSLKTLIAPDTSKNLILQVVKGNVLTMPADALVLKYSGGFNGASAQVFEGLKEFGVKVSIDILRTAIGSYQLMDSKLALPTPLVLYVSTPFVRQFKYADLTAFIHRSLTILKEQAPEIRHIAMTIHGVKFGLDEREAFITQINAIFDAFTAGNVPPNLEKISILETESSRVSRLIDIADEFTDHRDDVTTMENELGVYRLMMGDNASEIASIVASDAKPYILALMPADDSYDDSFYYGIQRPTHAYGLLCERESAEFVIESPTDIENLQNRIAEARGVIIHLDNKPLTADFAMQIGCVWGAKRPTLFLSQSDEVKFHLLPQDAIRTYKKISELEMAVSEYLKEVLG
jgi:hypothetical protein